MNKKSLSDRLRTNDSVSRAADRKAAKDDFIREHIAVLAAIPVELQELKARLQPGVGISMSGHRVIDHLLFRKLFAETFSTGAFGALGGAEFVIDVAGVRWHQTEEDLLSSHSPESDSEIIYRIENIIRPAMLKFLCSTDDALAWANRNTDSGAFYVPDWLIEALEQVDADSAVAVLADAGLSTYDELVKVQADGDHEGQKLCREELRSLKLAIEAFERIKTLLPKDIGDIGPVSEWNEIKPSLKAQRIQLLVIAAVNALKKHPADLAPFAVVEWLKSSKQHIEYIRFHGRDQYNNGASWKPLTHEAVQNQLDVISKRLAAAEGLKG